MVTLVHPRLRAVNMRDLQADSLSLPCQVSLAPVGLALRHSPRWRLRFACLSLIHLPASLCSTPITALQRYYGRSDSCVAGSSRQADEHQSVFHTGLPDSRARPARSFCRQPPRAALPSLSHATPQRGRLPLLVGAVWISPFTRRLIADTRPNHVRHPTD